MSLALILRALHERERKRGKEEERKKERGKKGAKRERERGEKKTWEESRRTNEGRVGDIHAEHDVES